MSKALVTGATGLVGYHIAAALIARGEEVRVLARKPESAASIVPEGCEVVAGDVTDLASVEAAARGCDSFYHAAGVPEQWLTDPSIFERVNLGGTRNAVTAALDQGVRKFIYTSTQDVLDSRPGAEFDESAVAVEPLGTAYQRSKQKADRIVVAAVENDGLDAVFLHPCAVYGPGPAQSPGMNDLFADLMLAKVPVLLAGGMSLVFSHDVASGHLLAADKAAAGARFVLAERYYSLLDLAVALEELGGISKVPPVLPVPLAKAVATVGELISGFTGKPPLIPKGQLHGLLEGSRPSADKAKRELGWEARPLSEGLVATLEYLRSSGKLNT